MQDVFAFIKDIPANWILILALPALYYKIIAFLQELSSKINVKIDTIEKKLELHIFNVEKKLDMHILENKSTHDFILNRLDKLDK